jgi:fatty acid desaturase
MSARDPIPVRRNAAIVVAITVVQLGLLVLVSHVSLGWWTVPVLVVFGVTGISTYQAMHEAEHGMLFRGTMANDAGGVWLAALFGGPFSFLRACHLGHHARNRTRDECFEIVWPGQSMLVRWPLFFVVFLGGFWALIPLSCLYLAVSPPSLRRTFVDRSKASAMVQGMPPHWMKRIRTEALFVIALHGGLLASGLVSPLAWIACYGAVALLWSSQNYLGHAHEQSFEVVDGAFNLDVNPFYGAWIMNFHWHLAHHQNPQVPWVHLPRYDDRTHAHRGYWRAYAEFLRGPVRATRDDIATPM